MPITKVGCRIAAVILACSVCNLLLAFMPAFICDVLWWQTERTPVNSALCEYWWALSYIIIGMLSGYSIYVIHSMAADARRVSPAPLAVPDTVPTRLPTIPEIA